MAVSLDRKKAAWLALFAIAASAAYVMYTLGYFDWWLGEFASGAGKFNPAMCDRAGIRIESVRCDSGVVRVTLSNTGRVPLGGSFVAGISNSAEIRQTFVANRTESPIRPGQEGALAFSVEGFQGMVSKVAVTFQPCVGVTAEKGGLSAGC